MTYEGHWRETFRPDIPSPARIYDYLPGGKDNYPADPAVAEAMIAQLPNVRLAVKWNRRRDSRQRSRVVLLRGGRRKR